MRTEPEFPRDAEAWTSWGYPLRTPEGKTCTCPRSAIAHSMACPSYDGPRPYDVPLPPN